MPASQPLLTRSLSPIAPAQKSVITEIHNAGTCCRTRLARIRAGMGFLGQSCHLLLEDGSMVNLGNKVKSTFLSMMNVKFSYANDRKLALYSWNSETRSVLEKYEV